jgi:hypothetical protein
MSFSFSRRPICLGVAIVVLGGLLVCRAQPGGKERGWPIEFSAPRSGESTNRLNPITSKRDGLRHLEEDLNQTPRPLTPQSSLDGVIARPNRPQAAPVIQSKRAKELLERRKNWMFMSPEEMMAGPTAEEVLKAPQYGADGQEKKETPIFDRFYRNMGRKRPGTDNLTQSKDDDLFGAPSKSNSRDESATQDDSKLPGGLRESAETLKKLFESGSSDNPFVQTEARGNLMDTFGPVAKPLTKEEVQEHKKYMDGYRSVVDSSWRPPAVGPAGNPLAIPADTAPSAWKAAAGLPNSSSLAPSRGFDAQSAVVNPMLGPPELPNVNAQALGQTRSAVALPSFESRRVAPVAPTFMAPSRSFR